MYCRKCAYDLRRQQSSQCPECGTPFSRNDRTTYRRSPSKPAHRFAIGFGVGCGGILLINLYQWITLGDRGGWQSMGFPFEFWETGGYSWSPPFSVLTFCLDAFVGITLGIAGGWIAIGSESRANLMAALRRHDE